MTERLEVFDKFILFQFVDTAVNGMLTNKISDILLAAGPAADSQTQARWGKPIAMGENVKDISLDEYILIEPLQWSMVQIIKLNGQEEKFWRTDETKVLAVMDAESFKSM